MVSLNLRAQHLSGLTIPFVDTLQSLSSIISRLAFNGLFSSASGTSPSQCTFPEVVLPRIRLQLQSDQREEYFRTWQNTFATLDTGVLGRVLLSFFDRPTGLSDDFDTSQEARGLIKREALLLMSIFGLLSGDEDEKWDAILSGLVMRSRPLGQARILVCWASASDKNCKFRSSSRVS